MSYKGWVNAKICKPSDYNLVKIVLIALGERDELQAKHNNKGIFDAFWSGTRWWVLTKKKFNHMFPLDRTAYDVTVWRYYKNG